MAKTPVIFPQLWELTDQVCDALRTQPMPVVKRLMDMWWEEYYLCKKQVS